MYSPYHIGQHIEAVVEQVLPFGVFVRLADGTRAYIWQRELTLDADMGLFFVRSLLERIGGAAKVEESYLPLGTTILVELPTLEHTEER